MRALQSHPNSFLASTMLLLAESAKAIVVLAWRCVCGGILFGPWACRGHSRPKALPACTLFAHSLLPNTQQYHAPTPHHRELHRRSMPTLQACHPATTAPLPGLRPSSRRCWKLVGRGCSSFGTHASCCAWPHLRQECSSTSMHPHQGPWWLASFAPLGMPYIHPSSLTPFPAADIDPGLREAGLKLYEEAARELASRYPQAWPEFTYERFAWAAGMVQSRTFHLQATNWVTGGTSDGGLERGRKGAGRCNGLALSLSARSPRACSLFEPSQHSVDNLGMRWSTKARSRGVHSTRPQHARHLFPHRL